MRSGDFGPQLLKALRHRGMSQRELAVITKSTPAMVSLYVNCLREPQLDKLIRILKALDMTLEELFSIGNENERSENIVSESSTTT